MLLPLPVILIAALAPALVLTLMRLRPSWVIAGAALSWAALGAATGALTPPPAPIAPGAHPVDQLDFTGFEALAFGALAIGFGVVALGQWIKSRLAKPDNRLILTGFWLAQAGLITTVALADALPPVADIAATVALAGVLIIGHALILRPALTAFGRAA